MGAIEVQRVLAEEVPCDPKRLLEPAHTLLVRESEGEVLALRVPGAEAEHQAAAADVVDGHRHLRHQPRIAVAGAGDQGADGNVRDRDRQGSQHREALEVAFQLDFGIVGEVDSRSTLQLGVVAWQQQMIGDVEGVEADLRGGARDFQDLRPMQVGRGPGGQDQAQPQPLGWDRRTHLFMRQDSTKV